MRRSSAIFLVALLSVPTLASSGEEATGSKRTTAGPVLGISVPPERSALPSLPARTAAARVPVRLVARWSDVETERGVYDWSGLESDVARIVQAGAEPVVCLTGSNPLFVEGGRPPSPAEGESVQGWLGFVRSAVRAFSDRVSLFEIWDRPAAGESRFDPAVYAFLLKNSAVAMKAEARASGTAIRIAAGAVAPTELEWQKRVWQGDVSAYVEVLPVRLSGSAPPGSAAAGLAAVFSEAVNHPPTPALWAQLEPADGGSEGPAILTAVESLGAPIPAVAALVAASPGRGESKRVARALAGLNELLDGFEAAPLGEVRFEDDGRRPVPSMRAAGRFLRGEDLSTLVIYGSGARELEGRQVWMIVDGSDVGEAQVVDPVGGDSLPTIPSRVPGEPDRRALKVVAAEMPMGLRFKRSTRSRELELPTESLRVETTRGLSAEEIIARYQEVQRAQDDGLERWTARGRADFHYKIAQAGSTVDVAIESNYFWERGGKLEWQQTDYYVNGNRIRWKTIPELPLIQPEKVLTLPLDLTLDRTYVYRLVGEDRVGGRDAYVLAFEPANPDTTRSLYEGKVWIDKTRFARLRGAVVQTNLETPVVSSEEQDTYEPLVGPDGKTYWMLTAVDGQQLWTAGGRNFVVRRRLTLGSIEINPPRASFDERRNAAYASRDLMLRDTDQGSRYLQRNPDGSRTVKSKVNSHYLFGGLGLYKDSSIDGATPLGGINWFDYDLFGKNVQANVFFAGALAFVNVTKPDLGGGKLDVAVEGRLSLLKGYDRLYVGDEERVGERIRRRNQWVALRLGIPLGRFFKITLREEIESNHYTGDPEAEEDLAERFFVEEIQRAGTPDERLGIARDYFRRSLFGIPLAGTPRFVLPRNHALVSASAQAEFNRRGWTVTALASWSHRSSWGSWGLDGGEGQPPRFDPAAKGFWTWRVSAFKEWYLPKFQKVRMELNYLDGRNLDRFSRYAFGFFGDTALNGFAGTGVRFDRGGILRGGYAFNLFNALRVDVTAETARVEDRSTPDGFRSFSGIGLSGNVVGPWQTIIQGGYYRAIQSGIPGLAGSQQFLLLVLKLF